MRDESNQRWFNGHVSRFTQTASEGRLACYRAEVVPWLWFLTKSADCFIHQFKTVPDILKDVFKKFSFSDYEPRLQAEYTPWEYCVQYRETAHDFVTRLMESEEHLLFLPPGEGQAHPGSGRLPGRPQAVSGAGALQVRARVRKRLQARG